MVGELDSKYQATRRASRWLQDRMAELRTQASEADALVQKFKAENNIVDTGRGLMSDQQLTDVNTQLIAARATTAEAKARLDRIDQIAREDVPDASVTDALKSEVITRLRAQYLDLAGRESDWSTKYGNTHLATINLRNQMKEIKRSIQDELRRIAQSFKSDYEIARAREASVESSLSTLVGQSNLAGQAQIKLRDLESTSQSYRNLYDNFLQRFMEATQQQTFAINEARVITAATESLKKSWPKPIIILPACLVLGLMMGVGAAAGREYLDNNFRTVGQVEQACGVECVGVLPVISAPFEDGDDIYGDPERRILPMSLGLLRNVVDAPFARYAETLRSAKVAIDIRGLTQETRVIGIVSALPNEGKTLVASNIAQLAASSGQRAILIDADLRNPSLTKATAAYAEEGLIEILSGRRTEADVRWTDPVTGLHVIPAVVTGRISHTAELISSPAMAALLARLRKDYDYIFLDLPPIAPIVDVRAAARLIDGFLVVIEWGRTTKSIVAEAIGSDELIRSRAVGAVLNKANKSMLRRLESYKGRYYNNYYHDGGYPT
jgi:succinoglycan biosynthesis transport protein ExoP